jgi:hypothetical protein
MPEGPVRRTGQQVARLTDLDGPPLVIDPSETVAAHDGKDSAMGIHWSWRADPNV